MSKGECGIAVWGKCSGPRERPEWLMHLRPSKETGVVEPENKGRAIAGDRREVPGRQDLHS